MATARDTSGSEAPDVDSQFLTEDIGTVFVKIKRKKVHKLVDAAEVRDQTLHFEYTSIEKTQEGFGTKVDIHNHTQAFHLYQVMAQFGFNHQFVPRRHRIIFDSEKLTADPDLMMALVDVCKEDKLSIVYLKPRKRLAFECFDLWDVYKMSRFCIESDLPDGRFFCTNVGAIQKRVFMRHHTVKYTDYK